VPRHQNEISLVDQGVRRIFGLAVYAVIGSLFCASVALAGDTGGQDGGGGKGIICTEPGGAKPGSTTVYLADTFDFVRDGGLKDIRVGDPSQMVAAVAEIIEKLHPEKIYQHPLRPSQKVSLAWLFTYTGKSLTTAYEQTLRDYPDDHIDPRTLPWNCKKVQIAYQDIQNKVVHYDMNLRDQLSWVEHGLLEVHEIFVALRHQPGKDTTPIRAQVDRIAKILDNPKFELSDLMLKAIAPHRRKNKTEVEWANEFYESNDCYNKYDLISKMYEKPADPADHALCRKAAGLRNIHSWMKWPKLVEFPKQLICKTTYKSDMGLRYKDPKMFVLTRTRGSGSPDAGTWHDEKTIYAMSNADRSGAYSRVVRIDARDQQYDETKAFGSVHVEMEFDTPALTILRLDDYNLRTQTFSGSMQFGGEWLGNQAFKKSTTYGVQCDGGPVKFEEGKAQ
jgi:hypothetical protein